MAKTERVIETLLYPYHKNLLPEPEGHLLFINAENHEILRQLKQPALIQPRFDKAINLQQADYEVLDDFPNQNDFDTAWILPGKDMTETRYFLARALGTLKKGGTIAAAAANDAGGKRLQGMLEDLGLYPCSESKHKARVVFAEAPEYNRKQAELWLEDGKEQKILNSTILSCPGLHSWDKTDAGSALLSRHLPVDLSGAVADFGCGWGYLSLQATEHSQDISRLTLVDIDARALRLARRNLAAANPSLSIITVWADLSRPNPGLGPFDAILLNPPFHSGTHATPALGQSVITTAAQSLKPGGRLYLVANKHLPYEKTLQGLFTRIDLLAEEGGFKALMCGL